MQVLLEDYSAHKLNIYLTSVQETQLRLYDELERVLSEFLSAVRILSKGYLPASLFPPTILRRIVKVPITDTNLAANSYTEVRTSKPYIAFNNNYYIQLHIPELRMCKQIWHSYYCEELFLVKHKSKHSCESAIYHNLAKEVINEYCPFKNFYNTTVMPSVLDGGPQILLANILTPKRLICTYASDMAHPVPSHDYVLVNRSMLCNCHMESGLTYLLKSTAFCETASADYTMSLY